MLDSLKTWCIRYIFQTHQDSFPDNLDAVSEEPFQQAISLVERSFYGY